MVQQAVFPEVLCSILNTQLFPIICNFNPTVSKILFEIQHPFLDSICTMCLWCTDMHAEKMSIHIRIK